MSVEFCDIDLNSDAFEASNHVNAVDLVESTVRVDRMISGESLSDEIRVPSAAEAVDDVGEEIRVSGELEEVTNGNVVGGVGMENGGVDFNEAVVGLGSDLGVNDDAAPPQLGLGLVDEQNVQGEFGKDAGIGAMYEKSEVSPCTREEFNTMSNVEVISEDEVGVDSQYSKENTMTLVVDLNVYRNADGERKSNDKIGCKITEAENLSSDQGTPFLESLVEDVAMHINGFENGNRDERVVQKGEGIKQFECNSKERKNVVDIKKDDHAEKEGEYYVSDLVWGKVKSHPWWPGQIYDPSAASPKAMKYKKKDCYLIAYFGDQTFAWNNASHIKPFLKYFSQMERKSNMDSFTHALDCALEEFSRRVKYGLACKCLPDNLNAKIKSQVTINAGIRKESSLRVVGDNIAAADSFVPGKLVQYLKELAQDPLDVAHRLDFVIARSQLLSFDWWKGYTQLSTFRMSDGLLEDDDGTAEFAKEQSLKLIDYAVLGSKGQISRKGMSIVQDSSTRKRKNVPEEDVYWKNKEEDVYWKNKEKCMLKLMSWSCSNRENILEEEVEVKVKNHSSSKKRGMVDCNFEDSSGNSGKKHLSLVSANKDFKVGDRIRKVADQLSETAPNTKTGGSTHQNHGDEEGLSLAGASHGVPCSSSEKVLGVKIPAEHPSIDEMLSQLSLAARDPMKDYNFLISIFNFFFHFRNEVCLEKFKSAESKLTSGTDLDAVQSGFEGFEDSYWTDRIIQGNSQDQVYFEPKIENGMPTIEGEVTVSSSPKPDSIYEPSVMNSKSQAEKTADSTNEKFKDDTPTLLILNFTDLKSVPREANLNRIFSRYGPLHESYTEVLKKSNRAKVYFKSRCDADKAFSSSGKFSIFGPSLVSYRLDYSPSLRKCSTPGTKRKRTDLKSVEGSLL